MIVDIRVLLGYKLSNLNFYKWEKSKKVANVYDYGEPREGGEYIGMDKQSVSSSNNEYKKPLKSSVLKAGKRTFFFDVNLASSNKRYLKITESRFEGEGQDRKRNSLILFPEDVLNFQSRLNEAAGHINSGSLAVNQAV